MCPNPKQKQGTPQWSRQFCYGEKLPMAWGVLQETDKPHKSIPSQYARETKHLTLRISNHTLFQMVEVDPR